MPALMLEGCALHWILNRPPGESEDAVYATVVRGGRHFATSSECAQCRRKVLEEQVRPLLLELFAPRLSGFVWTDSADIVIEESSAAKLDTTGLRGIAWEKVEVEAWWRPDLPSPEIVNWLDRGMAPPLRMLHATARAGALAPPGRHDAICRGCGRVQESVLKTGFSVDPAKWDGSDILYVDEFPAIPVISERFVQVLQASGIRNYSIIPTEEFIA